MHRMTKTEIQPSQSRFKTSPIDALLEKAELHCERVSSVTTGWRVQWTAEECARDLWQNFYDANRTNLSEIEVRVWDGNIEVSAPAEMDLDQAFFLGSVKSAETGDIGFFGEGLKVASLCLLRDFDVSLVIATGSEAVRISIADDIGVAGLRPLRYQFYHLPNEQGSTGTRLILEGADEALHEAFANAHMNFFYPEHPILGDCIAGNMDAVYVARTKNRAPGAIFYRHLKRANLELPIVLAINKPYKTIDKLTSRDRDRNAFGDKLRSAFYRTITTSGVLSDPGVLREVLEHCNRFWEQGHPLLGTLLGRENLPHYRFSDLFSDRYFAKNTRVSSLLDSSQLVAVREIEQTWRSSGRKELPHYFRNVGVPTAIDEYEQQQKNARAEAERKLNAQRRGPSIAEKACISLLEEAIRDFDPSLAQVTLRGVSYLIADTESLLGAWQRSRGYRSREIYLASKLFDGPFRTAFATHLHECSHLFGHDGSRGFTDALTQLIEAIAQRPSRLRGYARRWAKLRSSIRTERLAALQDMFSKPVVNSDRIESAFDSLSSLPMNEATKVIQKYLTTRSAVLTDILPHERIAAAIISVAMQGKNHTSESSSTIAQPHQLW